MSMIACKTHIRSAALLTLLIAGLAGCSGDKRAQVALDAGADDGPADCVQMQQAHVNGVLAPDQQTDVAQTVYAVLGGADFPRAMPYCSGARPVAR